eukprot:4397122-Amphidinium_carterae.2
MPMHVLRNWFEHLQPHYLVMSYEFSNLEDKHNRACIGVVTLAGYHIRYVIQADEQAWMIVVSSAKGAALLVA